MRRYSAVRFGVGLNAEILRCAQDDSFVGVGSGLAPFFLVTCPVTWLKRLFS
jgi:hypothetical protein